MEPAMSTGRGGGAQTARTGTTASLVIPSRFSGPPGTGNGGYVCGRIAAYVDSPVTVTLRQPIPLTTPMIVERVDESSVRVYRGSTLIAEATASPDGPAADVPGPVEAAEAAAVAGRARYYTDPAFPDCVVCGMGRAAGDGLRIFPGQLAGRPIWAAPWTPDSSVTDPAGTVRPEVVWAALDCPSAIAAGEAADLGPDTTILLGRMTASLAIRPAAGDQCRVIAWPARRDGRKLTAGSALLGPGGGVLATATAVWLTVPRRRPALALDGASS
jgi:hypothetical protein